MPHRLLEAAGVADEDADQPPADVLELENGSQRFRFPAGVKAAVFDVVDTLVAPSPPVAVAYQQAARRQGIELDEVKLAKRFGEAWKRQEAIDAEARPAYATSRDREWRRWQGIVRDVFYGLADADASDRIFADLWQHFAQPTAWRATRHGSAIIAAAVDAGLEVALASNFDERLYEVAAEVEPLVKAAHVFPSSELGWRKPSPAFFRAVENRLGLRPSELIMFGDNPILDAAAARKAGWHAHLLESSGDVHEVPLSAEAVPRGRLPGTNEASERC